MIVLDTHAWIWWASAPERLSNFVRAAIGEGSQLTVRAVSCWEIAMLVQKGRLEFDREVLTWLHQALALQRLELQPLTPEISMRAAQPTSSRGDPADRLIVATALQLRAGVVSKDQRVRSYEGVDSVW